MRTGHTEASRAARSAQAMARKSRRREEAERKPSDAEVREVISGVPRDQGAHAEDFTSGGLHFASGHGCDCSLYFRNDRRIRLCHTYGPLIEAPRERLRRLSVTDEGLNLSKASKKKLSEALKKKGRNNIELIQALEQEGLSIGTAAPGSGGRLLELWGDNRRHLSRGGPVEAPKLTQYQVNLLYAAARTGNNGTMKACHGFAMEHADP